MTLEEEVTQLVEYDPKDFEKTAPFVPASPFCKKRVHQHKDEAWDNQLINQLKKAGLDAEVKRIVEVLDEWLGPNHGKVWISDTLPADLNLPLTDEDYPAENTLQAFFIGDNLPSFVLTLFNLQNNEGGLGLEEHIHKYTVVTLQELNESLLDFCHDRFAILGCTFDMQNFNSESLKRELERKEEECEKFYDGPINLDAKVFENMTKAAVLLQGTSCVTCYMPSRSKHIDNIEYPSILLDQTWRNVVHLLIEFLTHTGQTTKRICCKSALKLEVATLEAACRVGRSRLVTIKSSSNAEVNDCVRKMNKKENCKLRLEPSDEIDGSFRVISQQSTIIFTKNEEGIATVTLTANQDLTSVEDGMDKTLVGNNKIETAVKLPVSKEMTSVEDESGTEIDERQNFKDKGVSTVTPAIEDLESSESDVERVNIEKNRIEEIRAVTGPAENIKTTHGRTETRDTHKKHAYQTPYSNLCKIVGLPQSTCKESDEDLTEKAWNFFCDVLGLHVQRKEILSAKRLKGHDFPREICVVFSSTEARNTVLKTGLKLAGYYPYIEEFLPTVKHQLLHEARSSFGLECAWSENGVVLVKMHDGGIVEVDSLDHLYYIMVHNFEIGCNFHYNQAASGPQWTTQSAQYSPPHQNNFPGQMPQRHPFSTTRAESFNQNTNRKGICSK